MAQELDPTSDAARTGEHADANREVLAKNAEANLRAAQQSGSESGKSLHEASVLADIREFSRSSNGDTWSIGKDLHGSTMVIHRGNVPSGGHETITTVRDFLNTGPSGPQHEALVAMLEDADDRGDDAQPNYLPGTI